MEQKPHKKEELMVANSVLKLAEDLLKVRLCFITVEGVIIVICLCCSTALCLVDLYIIRITWKPEYAGPPRLFSLAHGAHAVVENLGTKGPTLNFSAIRLRVL